jgi:hypothetical protein
MARGLGVLLLVLSASDRLILNLNPSCPVATKFGQLACITPPALRAVGNTEDTLASAAAAVAAAAAAPEPYSHH